MVLNYFQPVQKTYNFTGKAVCLSYRYYSGIFKAIKNTAVALFVIDLYLRPIYY